jgi:hypothetical protein
MNDSLELAHQRETIALQFKQANERLRQEGRQLVYENQAEAGNEIMMAYNEGALAVILVALPGVGKTGVGLEIMRQFGQHDESIIPVKNIYQMTGMSDRDWKTQLGKNVLDIFQDNIYHRGNLNKKIEDKLTALENGLITCDECHIAAGKNMQLSRTLRNAGLFDMNVLQKKRVKLLDISATPETVMQDYKDWGDKVKIVILKPSEHYKGFAVFKREGRLKQSFPLENYEDVFNLLKSFDERYKETSKKYFIFRTLPKGNGRSHLRRASIELGWADPINHDSSDKIEDVDDMMSTAPAKHTILIIKSFWRASKRINDTHVGGSFESQTKSRDTTATAQGLCARFCSTYQYKGEQLNENLRPIHYCDVKAIEEYLEWYEKGCDYAASSYSGPRIHSRDGKVLSRPSKVHYTNVVGVTHTEEPDEVVDINTYRIYDSAEVTKKVLTELGFSFVKPTEKNGFMQASLRAGAKTLSLDEVIAYVPKARNASGGGTSARRYYACYISPSDKATARYVVIIDSSITLTKLEEIDGKYPNIQYQKV